MSNISSYSFLAQCTFLFFHPIIFFYTLRPILIVAFRHRVSLLSWFSYVVFCFCVCVLLLPNLRKVLFTDLRPLVFP